MGLQDYIEPIAKVAEIAGKEYSIEQVCVVMHVAKWIPKGTFQNSANYESFLAVNHN